MFTGIIEQIGTVEDIKGSTFTIQHNFTEPFVRGESVALNGACMTITSFTANTFTVDIIEESRNRTSFDAVEIGDLINLERSAVIGQRNSGHNVAGHVDETGMILSITEASDFWLIRISINSQNRKYIIEKGSIALEGISLTISALGEDWLEVSIIPHTWGHTNLKHKNEGDKVNIEYDQAGKYILNKKL